MRLLGFNRRHLRGPKAFTPFPGPGFDSAAMAAAGMLALHANIHVHVHAPKNYLATTFSFIAGSLGYAVLSPVVNDFVGGYAISASASGRVKSSSSAGLANSPSPSKVVLLRDAASGGAASGQDGAESSAVATYASSGNTGETAHVGGSHQGDAPQGLSFTGARGGSTSRNPMNNDNDQDSNRDGPTPPGGGRPRRSLRLANGRRPSTEQPSLRRKRGRAGAGPPPPPPPPPGSGTTLGIEDGSKGNNDHLSAFLLGSLFLAGLVLAISIRAFNSCKGKKKKKRLSVQAYPDLKSSNTTSTASDIAELCLSEPPSRTEYATCGRVPKAFSAYCSNIMHVSRLLHSRLGDAIRTLVSATADSMQPLNYGLPPTEFHIDGHSLITETCKDTYCGALTFNMSMQQAMESVGRAGHYSKSDVGLRQTCRYLRRVLLYVSIVILTMFTRQLLWIILPHIEDGVSYVEQPILDPSRPVIGSAAAPVIESAILVTTPPKHPPHNVRRIRIHVNGSLWVYMEAKNFWQRPSDHQHVPKVGGTGVKVDVIPESQSAIEILEQIIPEVTTIAESKNGVKLDTSIAPVLAESLEEEDEVFRHTGSVMEPTQADDSEVFIYPGFVADVGGEHERADNTDVFVYQGDSYADEDDKDDSEVFIYPGAVDVGSTEPVVSNDILGEVEDMNEDSDTASSYVPARDIGTSTHAPQNSTPDGHGDSVQSVAIDKGKKKADLDVEDQTNDDPNPTAVGSTLPVFVAVPGHRRHRTRPKQRRKAWLARQAPAEAAQSIA